MRDRGHDAVRVVRGWPCEVPLRSAVAAARRRARELRREWAATLASSEEEMLICPARCRPVACWGLLPAEHSTYHRGLGLPHGAAYLSFAATLPESRRAGVGVALTDASFDWAAGQAYRAIVTDWRVTNLLASRFWPRRGFRPSVLRLYRSIP